MSASSPASFDTSERSDCSASSAVAGSAALRRWKQPQRPVSPAQKRGHDSSSAGDSVRLANTEKMTAKVVAMPGARTTGTKERCVSHSLI